MDKLLPHIQPTSLPTHFTLEMPPRGFNPLLASDKELAHLGLPHRPDPKQFPEASKMWIRAMSRVKKFVKPTLVVKPNTITKHARRRAKGSDRVIAGSAPDSWSGLIVSKNGIAYSEVWATWVVPWVGVPTGQSGNFFSSLWVGLDDPPGSPTDSNPSGTTGSLLQAGTEQDASLGYNLINGFSSNYYAFVEWFPGPQIQIGQSSETNTDQQFPVGPGQVITAHIAPFSPPGSSEVWGIISMMNVTTGVAVTPILMVPPTVAFDGRTITAPAYPGQQSVWIFEVPSSATDPPVAKPLADFGQAVVFGPACTAFGFARIYAGSTSTPVSDEIAPDDLRDRTTRCGLAGYGRLGQVRVAVEVRRLVDVVVIPVEDRGGRCRGRGHDPGPVGRADTPGALFLGQVHEEAHGFGVMVGDRHAGGAERGKDGDVQLGQRPVLPEHLVADRAHAHAPGHDRKLVVAGDVAQVPRADLGAHVPAVERRGRIPDAARLEVHVADHGHGMPAQPQVGKPAELRVAERHLEDRVGGQLEQRTPPRAVLDDQR